MYLFKFSACLAILWLIYILILEQQKNHHFKRFYLLVTFVLALVIPLLTITTYVEPVLETIELPSTISTMDTQVEEPTAPVETPFNWLALLWTIYGVGATIFASRFLLNLLNLGRLIHVHTKVNRYGLIYVLLNKLKIPHSFFKYIFLDKDGYENNTIPQEVLIHEEAHAKQLHSFDILMIESLQVVFWFHPLVYILKHHIKLNHEFLADQAVLNQGAETKNYQHILLQFSSNTGHHQLASAINYSSIKKRLTVMKTQTSKRRIVTSTVLLIPIIALLFYGLAERQYIERDTAEIQQTIENKLKNANGNALESSEDTDPVKVYLKKYEVYKKLQDTPPHYINKSNAEQLKMDALFSDLGGMYFRMSKANKAQVKRPIAPILPYVKITLNGETYYKKKDELTKEEMLTLPPPPPPPPSKKSKGGPNYENSQNIYNPSFLEYIIEMEQLGASFFLDGEQITTETAKSIAQNNQGKRTEMITQKDADGNYLVKLSHPQKKHLYARSIDLKVLNDNSYVIDGIKATKRTFVQTFNKLHQDITAEVRNKIMNIHVTSPYDISNEEVWFIFNSLQDYGFYRIVAPNQVINRAKGNTPFAIERDKSTQQKGPTAKEIKDYNTWAKKVNSEVAKAEKDTSYAYPIIKLKDVYRYKSIYNAMTKTQKNTSEPFPKGPPPPPPAPATNSDKTFTINKIIVKGNTKSQTKDIIALSKLKEGDRMLDRGEKISLAVRELWNSNLFDKVEIYPVNINGTRSDIEINVSDAMIDKKEASPTIYVNDKAVKDANIQLNKAEISKLSLALSEGKVASFKLKIPGVKTDFIQGSTISKISLAHLDELKDGDVITLFDIKDGTNSKLPPILITVKRK